MARIVTILALLTTSIMAWSQSYYATYLNGFAPFAGTIDDKQRLIVSNEWSDDLIVVDTITPVGEKQFKFYVRAANLNNAENKSYQYTDRATGKRRKLQNPVMGIVWGYADDDNFCAALLKCENTAPHDDLLDSRRMNITVIRVVGGKAEMLKQTTLDRGIDTGSGYNVLMAEYDGRLTSVSVGDHVPRIIAQFDTITYPNGAKFGLLAGPAARLAVERIVLRSKPIMEVELATDWTLQSLNAHFASSQNAIEGFYTFFDKELDERKLKIGGRYTVALVKRGNGYDIIYIDGAQVNAPGWQCGMLKGRIEETQFIDNYALLWYDATMRPFRHDVYATLESYTLLTLHFPAQKSKIRFARSMPKQL